MEGVSEPRILRVETRIGNRRLRETIFMSSIDPSWYTTVSTQIETNRQSVPDLEFSYPVSYSVDPCPPPPLGLSTVYPTTPVVVGIRVRASSVTRRRPDLRDTTDHLRRTRRLSTSLHVICSSGHRLVALSHTLQVSQGVIPPWSPPKDLLHLKHLTLPITFYPY